MPRPLSRTETLPSTCTVSSILSQNPARCSSIELSTTSKTIWCKPRSSGSPMYIPGRFRTASSPSSLSIWAASYFWLVSMPVGRVAETDFTGKSSSVFGIEDGRATTDKYGSGNRTRHNKYLGLNFGQRTLAVGLKERPKPAGCGRLSVIWNSVFAGLTAGFLGRKLTAKYALSNTLRGSLDLRHFACFGRGQRADFLVAHVFVCRAD